MALSNVGGIIWATTCCEQARIPQGAPQRPSILCLTLRIGSRDFSPFTKLGQVELFRRTLRLQSKQWQDSSLCPSRTFGCASRSLALLGFLPKIRGPRAPWRKSTPPPPSPTALVPNSAGFFFARGKPAGKTGSQRVGEHGSNGVGIKMERVDHSGDGANVGNVSCYRRQK